jgi:hypothetical protein
VHRVDTEPLARMLAVTAIRRGRPQKVKRHRPGHRRCGSHPEPAADGVDETLARYPMIWTAAGTADSVMPMTYEQLLVVTEGVAMPVR